MAYQNSDLLISHSRLYPSHYHREQQQQQHHHHHHYQSAYKTSGTSGSHHNLSNIHSYSSNRSLRVECTAEERHFKENPSNFFKKNHREISASNMDDDNRFGQFRSEIIVHSDPDSDVHIKRLRIALHYHTDSPTDALATYQEKPLLVSNRHTPPSVATPPNESFRQRTPSPKFETNPNRTSQSFITLNNNKPQALLHKWIDDICANEELMSNDDIVFFIKNGEFFARI